MASAAIIVGRSPGIGGKSREAGPKVRAADRGYQGRKNPNHAFRQVVPIGVRRRMRQLVVDHRGVAVNPQRREKEPAVAAAKASCAPAWPICKSKTPATRSFGAGATRSTKSSMSGRLARTLRAASRGSRGATGHSAGEGPHARSASAGFFLPAASSASVGMRNVPSWNPPSASTRPAHASGDAGSSSMHSTKMRRAASIGHFAEREIAVRETALESGPSLGVPAGFDVLPTRREVARRAR